ncbi:hypothetical protein [Chelativorans sp. AA-79]|uniref:hypothetical protein n=1 Tax=Chelativorans sp. AA-79 TaxID=3028735 RepID=UPI0023F99376|nr:hypothetical protein [Chelativorans sp. AA-79]WEX08749.1 hypothetical protein PVE73_22210 [Chelativorans sp. AA-79]
MERFCRFEAEGIAVTVDLRVGHIREFSIEQNGRTIRPLHIAPWVDDDGTARDEDIPANVRWLSGDFFCAPFSASDLEPGPPHGWPANSEWDHLSTGRGGDTVTARFALKRDILGARLEKHFTLRDGHAFLYERHIFIGGEGRIPVANHAMTRFGPAGGRLSFSPKAWGETPPKPLEGDPDRGRSALAYPARFEELTALPRADGRLVDLREYPPAERHEEFVMLVERPGNALGWAAAVRRDAGEIFLSLKNPAELPVTMLWFSNAGRDYAPWNGRHVGVLGIEEGRSFGGAGHRGSIAENPLSRAGIPTALDLVPGGSVSVRNVIGGVALPEGWRSVEAVEPTGTGLRLVSDAGNSVEIPCDTGFLRG